MIELIGCLNDYMPECEPLNLVVGMLAISLLLRMIKKAACQAC